MSKAANSPTARLLRSSRLFSLPRPLPAAQLDRPSAQGQYRGSDTATLPYPTHQAITTPASSNFRGDWGLKRPLPAKSTRRTSTPIIRVHQQDTYEHITDFASAADHALNARKWAEMGVPMVYRSPRKGDQRVSVYEESSDPSLLDELLPKHASESKDNPKSPREWKAAVSQQSRAGSSTKWRFAGPWIAGMHEDEFRPWLKKTLEELQENTAWLDFVSTWYGKKRFVEARRRATAAGETLDAEQSARLRRLLQPTTEQCKEILKTLRHEHQTAQLRSDLTQLICEFLELPNVFAVRDEIDQDSYEDPFLQKMGDSLGVKDLGHGPPSTHPGAGLSYIRTAAYMENHPLYGPQTRRSPVLARVLRTRSLKEQYARLGVGGFVTSDPFTATNLPNSFNRNLDDPSSAQAMTEAIDPDLEGGNKIWVHPENAHVDDSGSIHLKIARGDTEAIAVKTGDVENVLDSRSGGAFSRNKPTYQANSSGSERYSSGSIGAATTFAKRTGVTGFDQDSGFKAFGANGAETAISRVQNMLMQGRR